MPLPRRWLAGLLLLAASADAIIHKEDDRPSSLLEETGSWNGTLFIFGYGSLLKEMSRIKTTCNLTSISESTLAFVTAATALNPTVKDCIESVQKRTMILVKASGVKRGWYDSGKIQGDLLGANKLPENWDEQALDLSPTFLGAVPATDVSCYGVMYPVSREELALTDQREIMHGGVSPMWLSAEQVEVLTPGYRLPEKANVRWYALSPSERSVPTPQHPICQSYVDIFIGGALELAKTHNASDFAEKVVMSTHDWSKYWVNDRVVPYRPYVHESKALLIMSTLLDATQLPGSPLTMEHLASVRFPQPIGLRGWRSSAPLLSPSALGLAAALLWLRHLC